MKLAKRAGALLIVVCMLAAMIPAAFAATTTGSIVLTIGSSTMYVNGTAQKIDTEGTTAVINSGYTMLPLRGVVEGMGGTLVWDAATRSITMTLNGQTVKTTIGSKTAYVGSTARTLDIAPYISSAGRTLVHIRTLELFTGVSCTWNATTRQVTVSYPMQAPETTYRIDVTNKTGKTITGIGYATAGTYQYSGNVLNGSIANNGTGSFNVTIPSTQTLKVFDFYTEGGDGTVVYSGLNLSNCKTYASVALYGKTSGNGKFDLAIDSAVQVSQGDTELTFKNNSGKTIEELYMSTKDSSSYWEDAEDLLDDTVKDGKSTTFDIDLDGTKTWYFKAVSGSKEYVGKVTFPSATTKEATLTLKDDSDDSFSLNGEGDTELTFKNNSSKDIEAIYLSTTKSDVSDIDDIDVDDVLDGDGLDKGDDVTIDFDLESTKTWYMAVEFSSGSDMEAYKLEFENKDPASVTIRINSASDAEVKNEKKSGSSSTRGELSVALMNASETAIEEVYAVADADEWDGADRDSDDDFLSSSVDTGECYTLDEMPDEAFDLILYYDDGEDDYEVFSVDLEDADSYAALLVEDDRSDYFDVTEYLDTEDDQLLVIYNDTGASIDDVTLIDPDDDSEIDTLGDLSKNELTYTTIDVTDYDDITVEWDSESVDVKSIDECDGIIYLTLELDSDDDGDFTLEDAADF